MYILRTFDHINQNKTILNMYIYILKVFKKYLSLFIYNIFYHIVYIKKLKTICQSLLQFKTGAVYNVLIKLK